MTVNGQVDGLLMSVQVNGANLRCETNADFTYDIDMLPATNPNEGRWRAFIPGVQSWSITVNGNFVLQSLGADYKTVVDASMRGESFLIRFGSMDDVVPAWEATGTAYLRSSGLGAPNVGKANWTLTFQGSGAFVTNWDEFGLVIDANPIAADWPTVFDSNDND